MRTATESELSTARTMSELLWDTWTGRYGRNLFGLYASLTCFEDASVGPITWPVTTIARGVSYDHAEFHYISYAVRTKDGVRNPFDY